MMSPKGMDLETILSWILMKMALLINGNFIVLILKKDQFKLMKIKIIVKDREISQGKNYLLLRREGGGTFTSYRKKFNS